MCGLAGVFGDILQKDEEFLKDMLIFNQVRGLDSAGVASVPRHNTEYSHIKVFKDVGPATDLFYDKRFDKVFHQQAKVLLGHNRSATQGHVISKNAHPFLLDRILGMHNGTLRGSWKQDLKGAANFGTDSETLLANIQEFGPRAVFPEIEGAWACVWYDIKANTMNILRNKERSLYYAYNKERTVVYFGSEVEILYSGLKRDGRAIEFEGAYIVPEDTLLSWELPIIGLPLEVPKQEVIKGRAPVAWGTENWQNNKFWKPSIISTVTAGAQGGGATQVSNFPSGSSATKTPSTTSSPHGGTKRNIPPAVGPFAGMVGYHQSTTDATRCYRDPKKNAWIHAQWDDTAKLWHETWTKTAPAYVPFTKLALESGGSHLFKHVRHKKNKTIFYIGLGGQYLNESQFNAHMAMGCNSCQRIPEWGNKVEFLNIEHDFLCELCALDAPLLAQWKAASAVK